MTPPTITGTLIRLVNFLVANITVEWNLSNPDSNGAEESVLVSEVSSFQRLKEWYLGWEMVSCLQRCPQLRGVLIPRGVPLYTHPIRVQVLKTSEVSSFQRLCESGIYLGWEMVSFWRSLSLEGFHCDAFTVAVASFHSC